MRCGVPRMPEKTLDAMAAGGMYDLVGGGFHRYSTDQRWLVPHFEKMLYDNAQLAVTYLHGWQVIGKAHYRTIVEQTIGYMLRELALEGGGFASAQDADTDGKEGITFTWTRSDGVPDEMLNIFEGGRFIIRGELDEAKRAELFELREQRDKPARDDKAIASWNGLALAALAECGRVLGRSDWVDAARALGEFLLGPLSAADGRLHRTWRDGIAKGSGYLEDYADVANGLLELHAATGELRWLEEANRLARLAVELFYDDENGGFFQTAAGAEELVVRRKDFDDHPAPSGNSMIAYVLLRLSRIYGDDDLEAKAVSVFKLTLGGLQNGPTAFGWGLVGVDFYLSEAARDRDRRAARQRGREEGPAPLGSARGDRLRPGRGHPAARGQGSGRRQAGRLRVRAVHLPGAGDRPTRPALDRFGLDVSDVGVRKRGEQIFDAGLEHGMGCAGRAPDAVETAQRLVEDRRQVGVVAERRDAADREPGRLPRLVGARRPTVEERDPLVAGAEHHRGSPVEDEHERLHDRPDLAAARCRRLGRRAGRVGQHLNLDREPSRGQPFLDFRRGRVHHRSVSPGIRLTRRGAVLSSRRGVDSPPLRASPRDRAGRSRARRRAPRAGPGRLAPCPAADCGQRRDGEARQPARRFGAEAPVARDHRKPGRPAARPRRCDRDDPRGARHPGRGEPHCAPRARRPLAVDVGAPEGDGRLRRGARRHRDRGAALRAAGASGRERRRGSTAVERGDASGGFSTISEISGAVDAPIVDEAADESIFIDPGPTADDVQQGGIGDCWDMATFIGIVNRDPGKIRSMMTPDATGGASVTFYYKQALPPQFAMMGMPTSMFLSDTVSVSSELAFNRSAASAAGAAPATDRALASLANGQPRRMATRSTAPSSAPRRRRRSASGSA